MGVWWGDCLKKTIGPTNKEHESNTSILLKGFLLFYFLIIFIYFVVVVDTMMDVYDYTRSFSILAKAINHILKTNTQIFTYFHYLNCLHDTYTV